MLGRGRWEMGLERPACAGEGGCMHCMMQSTRCNAAGGGGGGGQANAVACAPPALFSHTFLAPAQLFHSFSPAQTNRAPSLDDLNSIRQLPRRMRAPGDAEGLAI